MICSALRGRRAAARRRAIDEAEQGLERAREGQAEAHKVIEASIEIRVRNGFGEALMSAFERRERKR